MHHEYDHPVSSLINNKPKEKQCILTFETLADQLMHHE
jgi:hypothetical protein